MTEDGRRMHEDAPCTAPVPVPVPVPLGVLGDGEASGSSESCTRFQARPPRRRRVLPAFPASPCGTAALPRVEKVSSDWGRGRRVGPQNSHGSTYKGARSSQGRGGERGSGGRPDGDGGWRGSPDGGPPVGSGRQEVGELPARAGVALVAGSLGEPVGAGTTWRCGVTDCLSTEAGLRGRGTGGGTTGSRRPAKGEGERGRRCRGRWAAVRMRKLASALSGGGWREGGTCGEGCAPSTLAG